MFDFQFHFLEPITHPFFDREPKVLQWLEKVALRHEVVSASINYIFCSDDYLLQINLKYLNHDYYTDIITFPYKEGKEIESDIYISIDRIKENANDYGVTFDQELSRVMVHGLLHLVGFGDKTDEDAKLMRAEENFCINML